MTDSNPNNEPCINICNKLLKGELSAIETYEKAEQRFGDHADARILTELRQSHQQSANRLSDDVVRMGGVPTRESGAWGTFANAVQSAANLIGEGSALDSLQRGEEHGISEYKEATTDPNMMPECRAMVLEELLPRCERNLALLEGLKQTV
ncbi:MAG: DUF2383 domain-containing protein [Opitutales bacterium]